MISKYLSDLGMEESDLPCGWNPDDNRQPEWEKERVTYGFDERETWSLDFSLGVWLYPRLCFFKEQGQGYPCGLTLKKWNNILDDMIDGFKEVATKELFERDNDKIEKAYKLLSKHYSDLWW